MTTYTKIVDYAAKDGLLTGNPAKIVKGVEIGAEFDAIATADATSLKPEVIVAATTKATPVDADLLPLIDSAASNVLKKLTWANLKATLNSAYLGISATAANASQLLGATWASPGAIGGTTPAAGSFTTLSANNGVSAKQFALTGAGTNFELRGYSGNGATSSSMAYRLNLDYLNGTSANGYIDFYRGSAGADGYLKLGASGADVATFTSTGLAVTGTLSASGSVTSGSGTGILSSVVRDLVGGGGSAIYNASLTASATNYGFALTGTSAYLNGTTSSNLNVNGGVIAAATSTGLAVTGALSATGLIYPQQATTAGAPAYVLGALYFDTTLNKLRVGGATAWETVTSV